MFVDYRSIVAHTLLFNGICRLYHAATRLFVYLYHLLELLMFGITICMWLVIAVCFLMNSNIFCCSHLVYSSTLSGLLYQSSKISSLLLIPVHCICSMNDSCYNSLASIPWLHKKCSPKRLCAQYSGVFLNSCADLTFTINFFSLPNSLVTILYIND